VLFPPEKVLKKKKAFFIPSSLPNKTTRRLRHQAIGKGNLLSHIPSPSEAG
jgi:hypothetical protein